MHLLRNCTSYCSTNALNVLRIQAEFGQSGGKWSYDIDFLTIFFFMVFVSEIVFWGHALAVRLDTDRGRYIPETQTDRRW